MIASAAGVVATGCAARNARFQCRAERAGASAVAFDTARFVLRGWLRGRGGDAPGAALTVYLEGDGRAWPSRHRPPNDPTPRSTRVLELAMADPAPRVLYLARPCQFSLPSDPEPCRREHWTRRRFSNEVVEALSSAIDQAKRRVGATRVELVGYSGGGVLAALLAAGRADVDWLVTIAAPLDLDAWVEHHGLRPLVGAGALRAAAPAIAELPQRHLVGARDDVVPSHVVETFLAATVPFSLEEIPAADHFSGWDHHWNRRIQQLRDRFTSPREERTR